MAGRAAAYLGPKTPIATVVESGSYALVKQAAELPDGFGIGWYPLDGRPEPVRVMSRMPIGSDAHALDVARRYEAECIVAHVQKAENGAPELSGMMPFAHGRYLFAHDGTLEHFDRVFARALRERLSDGAHHLVRGGTESELLFATWLDALDSQESPDAMANALEKLVETVQQIAASAQATASFAIVVTDGRSLVTLRTATAGPPPALYTIVAGDGAPVPATGRVVASEPLFPGAWSSLDPHSLVIFTVEEATTEAGAMPQSGA